MQTRLHVGLQGLTLQGLTHASHSRWANCDNMPAAAAAWYGNHRVARRWCNRWWATRRNLWSKQSGSWLPIASDGDVHNCGSCYSAQDLSVNSAVCLNVGAYIGSTQTIQLFVVTRLTNEPILWLNYSLLLSGSVVHPRHTFGSSCLLVVLSLYIRASDPTTAPWYLQGRSSPPR